MKFLHLLILVFVFCFNGLCQPSKHCPSLGDIKDVPIHPDSAVLYIKNYNTNHEADDLRHTKAIYIQSKTIVFLSLFFESEIGGKFKGIKFFLTNYDDVIAEGQSTKAQTLLSIAPVDSNDESDYNALPRFLSTQASFNKNAINRVLICPGLCDDSLLVWTNFKDYISNIIKLPGSEPNRERFGIYRENELQSARTSYDHQQGTEYSNNQTDYIYYPRALIERLNTFIKNYGIDKFPLFGIYFSSYNWYAIREMGHPKQTTLSFIPLKLEKGKYNPDLCTYIKFIKEYYSKSKSKGDYNFVENHGELCPQKCPER